MARPIIAKKMLRRFQFFPIFFGNQNAKTKTETAPEKYCVLVRLLWRLSMQAQRIISKPTSAGCSLDKSK